MVSISENWDKQKDNRKDKEKKQIIVLLECLTTSSKLYTLAFKRVIFKIHMISALNLTYL